MLLKKRFHTNPTYDIRTKAISNVLKATNRINENNNAFFKQYDLSHQQYKVLKILRTRKGVPASLSEIHERMMSRMCNTTRLIDKLVLKDMVTKSNRKDNKRKIAIRITENGLHTLALIDMKIKALSESTTKNLSPKEILVLNELLDKFVG